MHNLYQRAGRVLAQLASPVLRPSGRSARVLGLWDTHDAQLHQDAPHRPISGRVPILPLDACNDHTRARRSFPHTTAPVGLWDQLALHPSSYSRSFLPPCFLLAALPATAHSNEPEEEEEEYDPTTEGVRAELDLDEVVQAVLRANPGKGALPLRLEVERVFREHLDGICKAPSAHLIGKAIAAAKHQRKVTNYDGMLDTLPLYMDKEPSLLALLVPPNTDPATLFQPASLKVLRDFLGLVKRNTQKNYGSKQFQFLVSRCVLFWSASQHAHQLVDRRDCRGRCAPATARHSCPPSARLCLCVRCLLDVHAVAHSGAMPSLPWISTAPDRSQKPVITHTLCKFLSLCMFFHD